MGSSTDAVNILHSLGQPPRQRKMWPKMPLSSAPPSGLCGAQAESPSQGQPPGQAGHAALDSYQLPENGLPSCLGSGQSRLLAQRVGWEMWSQRPSVESTACSGPCGDVWMTLVCAKGRHSAFGANHVCPFLSWGKVGLPKTWQKTVLKSDKLNLKGQCCEKFSWRGEYSRWRED